MEKQVHRISIFQLSGDRNNSEKGDLLVAQKSAYRIFFVSTVRPDTQFWSTVMTL